ncbi:MAG: hypothetical protein ACLU0O_06140 [Collinsella sp.]
MKLTRIAGATEDSHEAILQQDICGNSSTRRLPHHALNLSNSAAIVLYEALRQTALPASKPAIG